MSNPNAEKIALLERALQRVLNRVPARRHADPASSSRGVTREGAHPGAGASATASSALHVAGPSAAVSPGIDEFDEVPAASAPPELLQSDVVFSAAAADATPTDETSFAAVSEAPPAALTTQRELEDDITEVEAPAEAQSSSRRVRTSETTTQAPTSRPLEENTEGLPPSGRQRAYPEVPAAGPVPDLRATPDAAQRDVSQIVPRFSTEEQPTLPRNEEAASAHPAPSDPSLLSSTKAMPPPPLRRSVPPSHFDEPVALHPSPVADQNALDAGSMVEPLTDEDLSYDDEDQPVQSSPVSSLRRPSLHPPSSVPRVAASDRSSSLVPPTPVAAVTASGPEELRAAIVERTTIHADAVAVFLSDKQPATVAVTFGDLLDSALSL